MDLIEFTTWPKHQKLFYKITSGSLSFALKTNAEGVIGLTTRPRDDCNYRIKISRRDVRLLKDHKSRLAPEIWWPNNIPPLDVFQKFWLTWKEKKIRLGHGNQLIATWPALNDLHCIKYVTFSNPSNYGRVDWKCFLMPAIEHLPLKYLEDGEPLWVKADDQLPDGAVVGGHEKEFLYIMRAEHSGSFTPGKFVPSLGLGFLPWGGRSHEKSEIEILCGYNAIWIQTEKNHIPIGAVVGGFSEDGHEALYIGRAYHEGHLIPGKVQPSHRCCYIPYEDREIAHSKFEILVQPNSKQDCVMVFGSVESNDDEERDFFHDDDDDDEDHDDDDDEDDDNNYAF